MLEAHGIHIKYFIGFESSNKLAKPCISNRSVPEADQAFILSYVAKQGEWQSIKKHQTSKAFVN